MLEFTVESVTVSAEHKTNDGGETRGTFVSWTVKSKGDPWTLQEAKEVTNSLSKELNTAVISQQLVKGALTKDSALARIKNFPKSLDSLTSALEGVNKL